MLVFVLDCCIMGILRHHKLIEEHPALKCKQIQTLTSLLCLDMFLSKSSMSTPFWEEGFSILSNCHFHPCQQHDGVSLTHHAIFSHTIFFFHFKPPQMPTFLSPSTPTLPPLPLGSGTGQLPVVWSLLSVVGTFIRQRTLRSCSMTRHP